jgi:signal transduction histidine kinase
VKLAQTISSPQGLGWARIVLAVAILAVTYLVLPDASTTFFGLLALFLVYSVVVALRGGNQRGMLGLAALFADTVYLLIVASYGREKLSWLSSVFFLYLMTEALAFYSLVEVIVIVVVAGTFCAVLPVSALRLLGRTVVVAGALACGFASSKRRQTDAIKSLETQLGQAREACEKAREEERVRIAGDFHDGPLQSFISLQMRLEILRKLLERDVNAGMEELRQLQTLANAQIRDLRVFLHSMRPVDVDGGNLVATARRTAELFQKESGIPVTFLGSSAPVGLPQEMSLEVLQMIREALNNVQKHSGATRVAVSMEKSDRGLDISIEDNGHGFTFAGSYSLEELELLRLGPASLKRRARGLNAELQLESRPGRGAGLKVRIPLQ